MKSKKLIVYIALAIVSLSCLIGFIFLPVQHTVVDTIIAEDSTKIIYIIQDETSFLGKSIAEWRIVISIIGFIVGTTLTCTEYNSNKKQKQQEKGAEIARLFSDELVDKCCILGEVITKSSLQSLLKLDVINDSDIHNFDVTEIIDLFKDKNIFSKYEAICRTNELDQIYYRLLSIRISAKKYNDIKDKVFSDDEAKELFILDNKNLPFRFMFLVSEVLNKLEATSMHIASQSTSSIYIYQSLHQMFLRTIRILVISIAYTNENYANKYYTNIIHVYNMWMKMLKKQQKNEKKNKEKAYKKLNPKINTVQ
ncbi:MAG: hypothetical protein Q4D02_01705 [Clostridia bacterium]|nr:hypothetical protein [Clostridia bacterium]